MSEGIEAELAESQRHDKRQVKRLAHLLEGLSEQAVSSIPRACQGWAETIAAYRFLENPVVSGNAILSGPQHARQERLQAQEVVLLVQAPTCLNYGTLRPKHGMGIGKDKLREEYL